jgi:hypothetical protein
MCAYECMYEHTCLYWGMSRSWAAWMYVCTACVLWDLSMPLSMLCEYICIVCVCACVRTRAYAEIWIDLNILYVCMYVHIILRFDYALDILHLCMHVFIHRRVFSDNTVCLRHHMHACRHVSTYINKTKTWTPWSCKHKKEDVRMLIMPSAFTSYK